MLSIWGMNSWADHDEESRDGVFIMGIYQRILVATETLEGHGELVSFLQEIGGHHSVQISLLCVLQLLTPSCLAFFLPSLLSLEENLHKKAKENLSTLAKNLGLNNQEQILKVGKPHNMILERAKEMNADLIILGNDKRHFIEATASTILKHAPCDILVMSMQQG